MRKPVYHSRIDFGKTGRASGGPYGFGTQNNNQKCSNLFGFWSRLSLFTDAGVGVLGSVWTIPISRVALIDLSDFVDLFTFVNGVTGDGANGNDSGLNDKFWATIGFV